MAPLLIALLAFGPSARAQADGPPAAVSRLVLDASRALQSANAPLFMGLFDRAGFEGYSSLREDIRALTVQRRIASSVSVGSASGGPEQFTASVDWLLELTPKLDPGPLERRRESVSLTIRKRGKRWRIVDLAPADFFAPGARGQ